MAFTRSGVRLPLAPPAFARFAGYGSGKSTTLGGSPARIEVSTKYRPSIDLDEKQAFNFEKYLKSPSGRAISKKRL